MFKKWISQALAAMLHPVRHLTEDDDPDNARYKVTFLNNVFLFSGVVSFSMAIIRWDMQPFIGRVDLLFACLAFALLWLLHHYKKTHIELISSVALWLCFVQFVTVFFLANGNSTRSGLLLLILAAAFYLKGRRAGFYMLTLLLLLVVSNQASELFPSEYTHLDILSLCFYLLAQFFIIRNYECLRETQTNHLKALNTDLEALVKQRTEQLAAANTALEIEKENLKTLSSTDHLTGLSNRHHFESVFASYRSEGHKKVSDALILIDIDHFKRINDTYGHVMGDAVIKSVAQCLRKHSRMSDIIVRWGGDELIVYAPRTTLRQATKLAEKIRLQVNALQWEDLGKITMSAGVAILHPGDSLAHLLHRADQALYQAKEAGRNQVRPFESPK